MVLLWEKRREKGGKHGMFNRLWVILFNIDAKVGPNTFYLTNLEGEKQELTTNGQHLKFYLC
jgi:hypothetical protein